LAQGIDKDEFICYNENSYKIKIAKTKIIMKKTLGIFPNRIGLFTLGRNVYFKKGKHTLNLSYFFERFLVSKQYAKNR
jgi:hypothetical protein